jgi:hypothetical protein
MYGCTCKEGLSLPGDRFVGNPPNYRYEKEENDRYTTTATTKV